MSGSYHGNVLACRRARISLVSCTLQSSHEGYGLVSGHCMGGDGNRTGGDSVSGRTTNTLIFCAGEAKQHHQLHAAVRTSGIWSGELPPYG